MSDHCKDVEGLRALGSFWEERFCEIASQYSKMFTPHQIGRIGAAGACWWFGDYHVLTLPDVTVWTAPGEHHEIKHKNPTGQGLFGLEHYRFNALRYFARETRQSVYYTIHNWDVIGRNSKENRPNDWFTCNIETLQLAINEGMAVSRLSPSLVAGKRKEDVPTWYWPTDFWRPLVSIWEDKRGASCVQTNAG